MLGCFRWNLPPHSPLCYFLALVKEFIEGGYIFRIQRRYRANCRGVAVVFFHVYFFDGFVDVVAFFRNVFVLILVVYLKVLFKSLVGCSTSWQTPDGVSESMLIGCLFVTSWLLFAVSSFGLSCEVVAMMCSCGSTGVDWCAGIIDMRSVRGLVLSAGVMEISCGSCSWFCFFGEWVIRWMILSIFLFTRSGVFVFLLLELS